MTPEGVHWLSLWILISIGFAAFCCVGAVGMMWLNFSTTSKRPSAVVIWLFSWLLVGSGALSSVIGYLVGEHVVAEAGMLALLLGIAGIAGIVIIGTHLQSKH
jgi:hypothetical protein